LRQSYVQKLSAILWVVHSSGSLKSSLTLQRYRHAPSVFFPIFLLAGMYIHGFLHPNLIREDVVSSVMKNNDVTKNNVFERAHETS